MENLKIAIVTSPSGVDDGSFNQDNYNGILKFIESHPGATVTPVREETGDPAAVIQAVADIVADYNVIVCPGFQFSGIGTIATDNPDVDFILVDTNPTDSEGNDIECDNIYAMTSRSRKEVPSREWQLHWSLKQKASCSNRYCIPKQCKLSVRF